MSVKDVASTHAKEIVISLIAAGKFAYNISDKDMAKSTAENINVVYNTVYDSIIDKLKV